MEGWRLRLKKPEKKVEIFEEFLTLAILGNWRRVIELANQLKERPDTVKQFETLGWFLIGE